MKIIKIEGMMCENCANHVKSALLKIKNVKNVEVSLKDKNAIIEFDNDLSDEIIKKTIEDEGYKVVD